MRLTSRSSAATALCLLMATPLAAQSNAGGFASAAVAAMTIEDGVSAGIVAAVGYRFNEAVALGVELTSIPTLDPEAPDIPSYAARSGPVSAIFPSPFPLISVEGDGGHATIFTTNIWLSIPTGSRRIAPYVAAGGGVGAITDKIKYSITYPPIIILTPPGFTTLPVVTAPYTESIKRTTTDFAATVGGGVRFAVGSRWSVDADGRYIAVLGRRDAHIARASSGMTFRF